MIALDHELVRDRILSKDPIFEAEIAAHLEGCPDCRAFAKHVQQQVSLIKETLHARWDPLEVPQQPVFSSIGYRRNAMVRKVSSTYRAMAWAGGLLLLAFVLSWAIPRLVLGEVFPVAPSFLNLFRQQPPTANEIMPSARDLGAGWQVTADKADIDGSAYFDLDQNGYPIIGTHVNNTEYPFDQDLLETVSIRGFAHAEQHWTLMAFIGVFKDTAGAETVAKQVLPDVGLDRDIPMDRYTFTDVALGDEAKMVSLDDTQNEGGLMSTLAFRKGRTLVMVITLEGGNSPAKALDEAQMLEFGQLIESRIPY